MRTAVILSLVVASLAAAGLAAQRSPTRDPAPPVAQPTPVAQPLPPPPPVLPPAPQVDASAAGDGLAVSARLARRYLDARGSVQYLEVDVTAQGPAAEKHKVPVNAVLVIDRSGSMAGPKIARARDAARALVENLDGEDRLAIVDFASDAHLLLPSTAMAPGARERALQLLRGLVATSGTNLSAALELAAPQLREGRSRGRLDKVFLASDGQANEGVFERAALSHLARARLEGATISTFGIGDDYDEEFMTALAAETGGRARYIDRFDDLAPAVRGELVRASEAVARDVHLRVRGSSGAQVLRVLGFHADAEGTVRLPDFAAGETRRVLVKLRLPGGSGEAQLAEVALAWADPRGGHFAAKTSAGGTFTADAGLLGASADEAALHGAKAEMAELAEEAVQLQAAGRADAAGDKFQEIERLSNQAARDVPAAAPVAAAAAKDWAGVLSRSGAGGSAERKAARQKAYDQAAAPVQGW